MRILHLPHGYWPSRGGAEDLTVGLSEGLARRGHDLRVVVMDLATPEGLYRFGIPPNVEEGGVRNGVTIRRVDPGTAYRAGGILFRSDPYRPDGLASAMRSRSLGRLRAEMHSQVESFGPDVVMTTPHLFANVRAAFDVHRERDVPLVWMPLLHETDPNWPFDEVRTHLGDCDAVIAVTEHERSRLVEGYGVDPGRVHVVAPAVDLPPDTPHGDRAPTVTLLGRLTATKGIDLLGEAMGDVWSAVPDARLVVAGAGGPGSEAVRSVVDGLAKDRGPRSVELAVDVSDERKSGILDEASVLVLPSTVESYGLVLLEAWAHGVPVIAMDTPVMRSVVDDGVDGLLVPPTADALGRAIARLLGNPAEARALGAAGRAKVEAGHTWDVASSDLESVYEEVTARRRR